VIPIADHCTHVLHHGIMTALMSDIVRNFRRATFQAVSSGEASGFKVGGGVRGGTGWGVRLYALLLGARGSAPGKIFKLQMHAGEF
jgi:hypothetical protein